MKNYLRIKTIEPDILAALEARAQSDNRSVEEEVREILWKEYLPKLEPRPSLTLKTDH